MFNLMQSVSHDCISPSPQMPLCFHYYRPLLQDGLLHYKDERVPQDGNLCILIYNIVPYDLLCDISVEYASILLLVFLFVLSVFFNKSVFFGNPPHLVIIMFKPHCTCFSLFFWHIDI